MTNTEDKAPVSMGDQGTLFDRPTIRMAPPAAPDALSATGLVSYARCPRQFYWLAVRPLRRRASAAARIGTEIHRWIELRGRPQLDLLEVDGQTEPADEPADPGAGPSDTDEPRLIEGLRNAFLASPYAGLAPVRTEAPFALAVAGRLVRGRVDAVYRRDGRLELVDFKTGSPPSDGDRGSHVQLDLYAVAAVDVLREDPADLRTTYCYLRRDGTSTLLSSDWGLDRLAAVRANLAAALDGLAAGKYRATPGAWCARCEWQEVCRPGRAWLEVSSTRQPEA
jgi:RecB family exonuclease